jgi:CDGSH-type Zn-finger protein/uncharacterized Fe-S cluster protein YjdI
MGDSVEEVAGEKTTIRFDAAKCIHARQCVLSRPDVFVPNVKGQWIHPDRATPEEIAALAAQCPSGAISYLRRDGGAGEQGPVVNVLRVRENGPLAIHALLKVNGIDAGFRATLCRCGASTNKPFCDGTHAVAGFEASGEPEAVDSTPLAVRNGPVEVKVIPNGPLKVEGPLEVVSGTGRTINRVTQAFLCRCGASGNKPYCDGTHKRIGFTAA